MKKTLGALAFATTIGLVSTAASASPSNFPKAVNAALYGPEIKKLKIYDHEFNVKKAYITKDDGEVRIQGQISHHLSRRPDDQVYYTITKTPGKKPEVEKKVSLGGASAIAAPVAVIASAIASKGTATIGYDTAKTSGSSIDRLTDGDWETVADQIIVEIGRAVK